MPERTSTEISLDYIRRDLDTIQLDIKDIKNDIKQGYVTKEVFEVRVGRMEKLVYGMVAIILSSFLMAIAGLVFVL